MTEQRTPGNWHVTQSLVDGRIAWFDVMPVDDKLYRGNVAYVHPSSIINGVTVGEAKANAVLIAAAPAMLEALQALLSANVGQLPHVLEQARLAVAKAEGTANDNA